jgi:DNA-binding HxlR family transcriptional regulator
LKKTLSSRKGHNLLIDKSISQKNMTTQKAETAQEICPAQELLKMLSGKWKPQIFRFAVEAPLRFNRLLRQMEGASKQSIAVALRELEQECLLEKTVIRLKPLHIEYVLSAKGQSLIPIFRQLENLSSIPEADGQCRRMPVAH